MNISRTSRALVLLLAPIVASGCTNKTTKLEQPQVTQEAVMPTGDVYIDHLLTKLNSNEASDRIEASNELNNVRNDAVIKPLIAALSDKDNLVQENAARALGKMKATEAVDALIKIVLENDYVNLRSEAIAALGEIGDYKAVKTLCSIVNGNDRNSNSLSEVAVEALTNIGHEDALSSIIEYSFTQRKRAEGTYAIVAAGKINKEKTIASLMGHLNSQDNYRIQFAASGLGFLKAEEATTRLITLLKHENEDVRTEAAIALGHIGTKEATLPLCELLKSTKGRTFQEIVEALGEIKDSKAVSYLIESLSKTDIEPFERARIIWALENIGDSSATKTIANRLKHDDNSQVKRYSAHALSKIGDPSALDTLNEVKQILIEYQGDRGLIQTIQEAIDQINSRKTN